MHILHSLKKTASLDYLHELVNSVKDCAITQGFDDKRLFEVELALEETLVNVCNYAYPDKKGEVEVSCGVGDNGSFFITIVDEGVPFDYSSLSEPDLSLDLEDRQIGGLGVFLIKKLTDHISYERSGDKNILNLYIHHNKKRHE